MSQAHKWSGDYRPQAAYRLLGRTLECGNGRHGRVAAGRFSQALDTERTIHPPDRTSARRPNPGIRSINRWRRNRTFTVEADQNTTTGRPRTPPVSSANFVDDLLGRVGAGDARTEVSDFHVAAQGFQPIRTMETLVTKTGLIWMLRSVAGARQTRGECRRLYRFYR